MCKIISLLTKRNRKLLLFQFILGYDTKIPISILFFPPFLLLLLLFLLCAQLALLWTLCILFFNQTFIKNSNISPKIYIFSLYFPLSLSLTSSLPLFLFSKIDTKPTTLFPDVTSRHWRPNVCMYVRPHWVRATNLLSYFCTCTFFLRNNNQMSRKLTVKISFNIESHFYDMLELVVPLSHLVKKKTILTKSFPFFSIPFLSFPFHSFSYAKHHPFSNFALILYYCYWRMKS